MTALSVNLNKIAWLRNARGGTIPDIVEMGRIVIDAGAAGLTVHPRPDQRHIHPDDVYRLAELVREHPGLEYNIEGNPFAGARDNGYPGFLELIEHTRPDQATLVPDGDDQLTSDHGWQLTQTDNRLLDAIERCHAAGARVSLFMDPDTEAIARVPAAGADRIELYTGPYAHAHAQSGADAPTTRQWLQRYATAAQLAADLALGVNAGHDLDLHNLKAFLTSVPGVAEVSIGHALIAEALRRGLSDTVRAYVVLCRPNQ